MKKELELYLHIPFCVRKCAYCDFLSAPSDEKTRERYVETLIREIRGCRETYLGYNVSTIFMGGGTPSILTSEQIRKIFTALRENFEIIKNAEITIEVNPGTVTKEKFQAWKRSGINRLSIGLQTVKDEELKLLGRIHSFEQFLATFHKARKAGFSNINIDLISAIPGQTLESWKESLETVAKLSPEHISAYSLIIEEGTPFYEKYSENEDLLPDEDTERMIYEETEKTLENYGYSRYEISNYAKEGYQCRHNCGYWERKEYLGLGLGSASFIQKRRFNNISDIDRYLNGEYLHYENEELLSNKDEMEEFMFLGLRMMKGIQKNKFEKLFGKNINVIYGDSLEKLKAEQLIVETTDSIKLTKRGIDISNYVFEQFLLD